MSALHFAAVMLRRGRPTLRDRIFRWVVGNEVSDRRGDLAAIGACLRGVAAMPSLTSSDQPSAVLKATTQTGDEYWPSSRWRISFGRSVWATLVSGQAKPSLAINETAMKRWLAKDEMLARKSDR